MSTSGPSYFGKYRGVVVDNVDVMKLGRLKVQCADATALFPTTWAMPCVPFAGIQAGMFCVPPIGAGVWVEFEAGDIDRPIWVGGYFGSIGDVPALAQTGIPVSPPVVIQTMGQNMLMISDTPGPTGGILLKTTTGAMISISSVGILISNGQGATIMMNGPQVLINGGALSIT